MTQKDKDWQMRAQIALFAALKSGQAVTYDALAARASRAPARAPPASPPPIAFIN